MAFARGDDGGGKFGQGGAKSDDAERDDGFGNADDGGADLCAAYQEFRSDGDDDQADEKEEEPLGDVFKFGVGIFDIERVFDFAFLRHFILQQDITREEEAHETASEAADIAEQGEGNEE